MNERCTLYRTADFIGKRWTLPILHELYKGHFYSRRYSELKKALPGITAKMLSERLKELEHHGLIRKTVTTKSPPIRCDYSLTESGKDFVPILQKLKKWALKNSFRNKYCESTSCDSCEF